MEMENLFSQAADLCLVVTLYPSLPRMTSSEIRHRTIRKYITCTQKLIDWHLGRPHDNELKFTKS